MKNIRITKVSTIIDVIAKYEGIPFQNVSFVTADKEIKIFDDDCLIDKKDVVDCLPDFEKDFTIKYKYQEQIIKIDESENKKEKTKFEMKLE